ncbi:tryptophan 7-halogenase [Streptomyces varsoviensis]|uniref:tryptophan 7-halogenase n=1 Tax=Streptomyces varsoviensis TaxID=67373 RepID=UPI0004CC33DF|nr:tryptophan 7-halogenase [Streptomyces varsoviensis]
MPRTTRRTTDPEYDVIVVGGGPGGSTVATLTAMRGARVLLLEKERFPRYQIGESLLPATVHGIGKLLGVLPELEAARFTTKRGGTFRWGKSPEPWTFAFAVSSRFPGPTSTAYQVERMRFDQILLDNARRKGVEVRERCPVVDVLEADGRVGGVRFADPDGVRREARARFVVDASGNGSRIHGRTGGRRVYSEFFKNIALFGYFEGGRRLPEPNSGNILCAAFESGWFWYIPLTDQLTSVGAVLHRDALERVQGDREQALARLIEECPLIAEYLADARRVTTGPYGEIRVRKDYSYCQERFWRPGMVLVGDAACFIDPVFSSGVHLSTYSALLAARSINTVLSGGPGSPDETRCFEEFEARYRDEFGRFHDFLMSFYDMRQDSDSYFWTARRITHATGSPLEAFVELVGGGASDEGALFDSPFVDATLEAGAKVQVQAALGESFDDEPIRENGLVPSLDGMRWTDPGS